MAKSPCSDEEEETVAAWISNGGVVILIIGLIQCCWALAHVCDHYFCASMRILCEEWKIPDNVAGATFMAIGTSAADLIIAMLALFVSKSTIGLGTIIGSSLFNHLCICAGSVLASNTGKLKLNPRIITRDCFFYLLSLLSVFYVARDANFTQPWDECFAVSWHTGLVLLTCYFIYALITIYFDDLVVKVIGEETPLVPTGYSYQLDVGENDNMQHDVNAIELTRKEKMDDILDEYNKTFIQPIIYSSQASTYDQIELAWHYFTLPLHMMIFYTIPNMTEDKNRKKFLLASFLSILWLGLISEGMITILEILGKLMGIKATLMGLTISSVGASMPTLWSSIVVSRQGYGDMALSNAIGANTFCIFVGIGLPYFAYPLYTGKDYGVEDGGIQPLVFLLILLLAFFYLLIYAYRFQLHFWMGYIFLLLYLATIVFICIVRLVILK